MSWMTWRRNWGEVGGVGEEGGEEGGEDGETGVINKIQASDVIQAIVWLSLKKRIYVCCHTAFSMDVLEDCKKVSVLIPVITAMLL